MYSWAYKAPTAEGFSTGSVREAGKEEKKGGGGGMGKKGKISGKGDNFFTGSVWNKVENPSPTALSKLILFSEAKIKT